MTISIEASKTSTWKIDKVYCSGKNSSIINSEEIANNKSLDQYFSFLDGNDSSRFCSLNEQGREIKAIYNGRGRFQLINLKSTKKKQHCKYLIQMTIRKLGQKNITLSIPKKFYKGKLPCSKKQLQNEVSVSLIKY